MTNATDSVADDMLRPDELAAFASEIEGFRISQREAHFAMFGQSMPTAKTHAVVGRLGDHLPRKARGGGVNVAHAARWLSVCELLCRSAGDFDSETRRGWVIACRLLGLRWTEMQFALRDTRVFGAPAAASVWAPFMAEPDQRFVGKVYTAVAIARPKIIKVGFSKKPHRRMRELARTQHCHVELLGCRPGTMLHEWALHHLMRGAVEPEWYPADRLPRFISASVTVQ